MHEVQRTPVPEPASLAGGDVLASRGGLASDTGALPEDEVVPG